jgi:hypothetical protein
LDVIRQANICCGNRSSILRAGGVALTGRISPSGKSVGPAQFACPAPREKIFLFSPTRLRNIYLPVLSHRGAYPDRQRRGAGCGGRGSVRRVRGCRAGWRKTRERSNGVQTNGAEAYGEVVWFRHPLLVSNRRRRVGPTGCGYAVNSPMTVTRRIRRRGERVISRKAIAQGMSDRLR